MLFTSIDDEVSGIPEVLIWDDAQVLHEVLITVARIASEVQLEASSHVRRFHDPRHIYDGRTSHDSVSEVEADDSSTWVEIPDTQCARVERALVIGHYLTLLVSRYDLV